MRKTSDGACSIGRSASDERVAQATRAKQTIATQLVPWQRTRLDDTTRSAVVEDARLHNQRMVAARFHARDQWNEMKKRRTSNIRRRRVPLQPGFRSWRFARRQRNLVSPATSPAPSPQASHSLLRQGLAISCSLLGFPLAFRQNPTILAPVIGLVLFR